jgi:hypothetical protein
MDTLANFFGSLKPARAGCGCGLGSPLFGASTSETMDATVAMNHAMVRYVELSVQGENLRQIMTTGVKIPCNVWTAYATARQDYLTKSQAIFDQLAARGITLEQVIYSGGKPAIDPNDPNHVRTVRVQAPLRPPSFVGLDAQCPGLPLMAGGMEGAIGWEPIPVELGFLPIAAAAGVVAACTAATMGACLVLIGATGVVIGIAGYAGYKIMQQVAITMREYESSPSRIVAAYTSCFQGLTKSGASTTDAANRCADVQTSAQQYAANVLKGGWGFWTWVGVGGALLVTGGVLAFYLKSRVSRALGPVRALTPAMSGWDDGLGCGCVLGGSRRARTRAERDEDSMIRERHRADAIARRLRKVERLQAEAQARNREANRGENARMYNRDLLERIRDKPFRISRY